MSVVRWGTWVACLGLVASAWGAGAKAAERVDERADEIVMPYACSVGAGGVVLKAASPRRYPISGPRSEQPFTICGPGAAPAAACETIVVHRFSLACDGGTAAWSSVVASAAALQPERRGTQRWPAGFAPLSALQARLVLPPQARFVPHRDTVTSEPMRAEGVVYRETVAMPAPQAPGPWVTEVNAAGVAELPAGTVAGGAVVASVTVTVLGFVFWLLRFGGVPMAGRVDSVFAGLRFPLTKRARRAEATSGHHTTLLTGLAMAQARLAEAELMVGALPYALQLREVLEQELDAVRRRLGDVLNVVNSRYPIPNKGAAIIRAALRDLERIERLAASAARDTAPQSPGEPPAFDPEIPKTVAEAYRVLGLNSQASAHVAKKLVDALRMTWHPDTATDDADRLVREARMKQINAAWDLLKDRWAQAA